MAGQLKPARMEKRGKQMKRGNPFNEGKLLNISPISAGVLRAGSAGHTGFGGLRRAGADAACRRVFALKPGRFAGATRLQVARGGVAAAQ